ncbi:unnamed protein product [Cuscuta epithymum]|uniref:Uncharacterized protein n=1 Tax=Cuscuta epithymum TaxID=186058 RepID=A0AAV0EJS4_9ASTE|nr:unnamed protein product [Cuscuta epithymum]CAH9123976.1 unnamed protein product [Cuscuta epithymum]
MTSCVERLEKITGEGSRASTQDPPNKKQKSIPALQGEVASSSSAPVTNAPMTKEAWHVTRSTSGTRDVMLKEGLKSLIDGPMDDDCLHAVAELILKISEKNRQHVEREQELLMLLSEERAIHKRLGEEIDNHKVRAAQERDAHVAELTKVRMKIDVEREHYIDSHLEEIAERWLNTPAGEDRLDKDGALCFNLGEYSKQQEIYAILKGKHGVSCIADWGLPFEIPNPEPEIVDPSPRAIHFGELPSDVDLDEPITSEEEAMLGLLSLNDLSLDRLQALENARVKLA